jgi:hypothetical protein
MLVQDLLGYTEAAAIGDEKITPVNTNANSSAGTI